uniref:Uncharacterized protein n=1 Tax=Cacopsylla melanoneura TaxID=428564 RepID=A0A8D9BEH9_9HEMI
MDWCRIDLAGVSEDQLRFQGDGNIWPVLTPWVGRNWSQRCPTSDSMSISGSFVCIMLDWFVKTGINNIWKISHHGFVPRRCQYLEVFTSWFGLKGVRVVQHQQCHHNLSSCLPSQWIVVWQGDLSRSVFLDHE